MRRNYYIRVYGCFCLKLSVTNISYDKYCPTEVARDSLDGILISTSEYQREKRATELVLNNLRDLRRLRQRTWILCNLPQFPLVDLAIPEWLMSVMR